MTDHDKLSDREIRWSTKKIDHVNPRPYLCSRCNGSEHFIAGKEKRRICSFCHKRASLAHRENNREYYRAKSRAYLKTEKSQEYRKDWVLRTRYGITLADYREMVDKQNGVCLICGGNQSVHRSLVVDHCHKTGQVRGLLCDPCNIGLANFRDNPKSLASAIEYLTAPRAICLAALKAVEK